MDSWTAAVAEAQGNAKVVLDAFEKLSPEDQEAAVENSLQIDMEVSWGVAL
jgi:hypothetical protein